MRLRLVLPATLAVAGLLLGACSSSDDDHDVMDDRGMTDNSSMGDRGMNRDDSTTTVSLDIPADAVFNATDVAFAQGMIPHHGQAIQMADMALAVSTNPDVTGLAQQIKAAQGPEIEQMTAWLTEWGQSVPDPNAAMDDNMGGAGSMMMTGMMSDADMARLDNSMGTGFDRMFLEMMILHHEGAIEMAQTEVADGRYPPVTALARDIITAQQAEIEAMNSLLAALPA